MQDIRQALNLLNQLISAFTEAESHVIKQALHGRQPHEKQDAKAWLNKYANLKLSILTGQMGVKDFTVEDIKNTVDRYPIKSILDVSSNG